MGKTYTKMDEEEARDILERFGILHCESDLFLLNLIEKIGFDRNSTEMKVFQEIKRVVQRPTSPRGMLEGATELSNLLRYKTNKAMSDDLKEKVRKLSDLYVRFSEEIMDAEYECMAEASRFFWEPARDAV
jgi:hypothetical protein